MHYLDVISFVHRPATLFSVLKLPRAIDRTPLRIAHAAFDGEFGNPLVLLHFVYPNLTVLDYHRYVS